MSTEDELFEEIAGYNMCSGPGVDWNRFHFAAGAVYYTNSNGEIHRGGGRPAVVCPNGLTLWVKDGLLHRDNGLPAVIWPGGGGVEFWVNGVWAPQTGYPRGFNR